jgi:hypothetical protein
MIGGPPLREADWRFLFPRRTCFEFAHLIVSGGSAGLEARLIDAGVARSASSSPVPGAAADAVALLPGSPVDPLDALGWLPDGKPMYVEVDHFGGSRRDWSGPSPHRLTRRLQGAGATIEGVYLIAGDRAGSQRFVQLDLPEALDWYVRNMVSGSTRSQLALQRFAGRCPDVARRLMWHGAARFAIVATRPPAGTIACGCPQRSAAIIQVTSGVDDGSRIVTLGLPAGASEPQWVRKTARLAGFNNQIETEHRALIALHRRLQPLTRRAVPCSLGVERAGALRTGTETAGRGASILDLAWRRERPAREKKLDLELATSWLIDAHRQLQASKPVEARGWLSAALLSHVSQAARYPRLRSVQPLVERVQVGLELIGGVDMPLTIRHGDFGPWNVLRRGRDLAVIDWENCRIDDPSATGAGLCDLLHLAMHWSFAARSLHTSQEQASGLLELVNGSSGNGYAVAARREIARYARESAIDGRLLGPLLVLTLLEHAVERERREHATARFGAAAENHFVTLLAALTSSDFRLVHW